MFGVTPTVGTYSFNLTVPSPTIGVNSAVFNTTATLAAVVLPALPAPVLGGGAGTAITVTVGAAPAGVTSRVIYVVDKQASVLPPTLTAPVACSGQSTNTPCFFAINAGTAAGTFNLGTNFTPGDRFYAWQVGADWDIVGGASPVNASPTPTLPAQTDVTVSPPTPATTF
jgi:hypothetical protein